MVYRIYNQRSIHAHSHMLSCRKCMAVIHKKPSFLCREIVNVLMSRQHLWNHAIVCGVMRPMKVNSMRVRSLVDKLHSYVVTFSNSQGRPWNGSIVCPYLCSYTLCYLDFCILCDQCKFPILRMGISGFRIHIICSNICSRRRSCSRSVLLLLLSP